MVYELGMAQILSATLGGTMLRYIITIGLFTAMLGLGAWTFEFLISRFNKSDLFPILQNSLAWIGLVCPFFLIEIKTDILLVHHLPILIVGFISGVELPLLMSWSKENERNTVLAFDYLGMFAATLLFPLLLLPFFGVVSTIVLASLLNAVLGLSFLWGRKFNWSYVTLTGALIIDLIILFNQERVLNYATQAFI